MEDMYKQCGLKSGNSTTSAWIQEKYAKIGLTGLFKDVPDDQTRWEVVSVGGESLPKSAIDNRNGTFITHAHPINKMRGNK